MARRQEVIRVAARARCFADDVIAACDACGARVFLRPHALTPRAVRCICIDCWVPEPGDTFTTTEADVREMLLYAAPTSGTH